MTPAEQDLARQLAAHPEWRWMNGIRLLYVGPPRLGFDARRVDVGDRKEPREGWIPDLSDPATQGCLIAMLGDRLIALERLGTLTGIFWRVEIWNERAATYDGWKLPGLGEALARAWLAVNREELKR